MNNQYSVPNPDINMLVRELSKYGRTVTRIHCNREGEFTFYVNPPYNGNETIVIQDMRNPKKFMEYALQTIRKIPEFEKINDKNLDAKARILDRFHNKYAPSSKRTRILGKIYHRKPRKTPDDFYEIFEDLMTITGSNSVSPEQLETLIKRYERKDPGEIIILPKADKYGDVDVKTVQTVYIPRLPKKPAKSLPVGLHRERLVRKDLLIETKLFEETEQRNIENNRFLDELIVDLAAELVIGDGLNIDQNELKNLEE
jgi:hypothetical protein